MSTGSSPSFWTEGWDMARGAEYKYATGKFRFQRWCLYRALTAQTSSHESSRFESDSIKFSSSRAFDPDEVALEPGPREAQSKRLSNRSLPLNAQQHYCTRRRDDALVSCCGSLARCRVS
jgi:hypothetical protein